MAFNIIILKTAKATAQTSRREELLVRTVSCQVFKIVSLRRLNTF